MVKYCKECKEVAEFYPKRSICKKCYVKERKASNAKYYKEHKTERASYMREYRRTNPEKVKRVVDNYYLSPVGKFKIYQKEARCRHIPWELTFEEFMSFWQKPCYYTGKAIETIGLDRLNSSEGYKPGNVVPCSKKVNWAKNDMALEEFLKMCVGVVKNLKLDLEK